MAGEVIVFDPPSFATLDPAEVDEAIHAGGIPGVISAIVARSGDLDPSIIEAVNQATQWAPVRRARDAVSNHREEPAIDHGDSLAIVERQVAALELVTSALQDVGRWLARNPGEVVADTRVAGGVKRAFRRP